MQHAQSRTRSRRWIGRGALAALAGLAVFGVSPALPALAALVVVAGRSAGVVRQLGGGQPGRGHGGRRDLYGLRRHHARPGVHQPEREDLAGDGPGPGRQRAKLRAPHRRGGHPGRRRRSRCGETGRARPAPSSLEAAVHPAGGSWGAPVTLSTDLDRSTGGLVLGVDGSGNVIAGWVVNPGDATDAVLPAGSSSWGPATTLSTEGTRARRTA